jgi:hypothetical protein
LQLNYLGRCFPETTNQVQKPPSSQECARGRLNTNDNVSNVVEFRELVSDPPSSQSTAGMCLHPDNIWFEFAHDLVARNSVPTLEMSSGKGLEINNTIRNPRMRKEF